MQRGMLSSMVDTTEIKLKADTEAVQAVAEAYQNIAIEHKSYGNSLPYRWEIQSVNPPKISCDDLISRVGNLPT
jgi:hypothetical protein